MADPVTSGINPIEIGEGKDKKTIYTATKTTPTTDKDGNYSVLSVAGNITLIVSFGDKISDDEKIRKVSNNILTGTTADDLLKVNISEEAAMRVPNVNSTFNIDIEIEPTNITGRLFWDVDKDGTFSGVEDEALAITSTVEDHEVVLGTYLGTSATRAGQEIEITESLEPSSIWGTFESESIPNTEITVSLYDETNGSLLESTFLSQNYLQSSDCPDENDDSTVSFCFEKLLPGNYT